MEVTRKHAIHTIIVFVVLWLGGLLLPQYYHFTNLGATILVTAAYMAVYFVFNLGFAYFASKVDFDVSTLGFIIFMAIDFFPGFIALYLMAIWYAGFWTCSPWLIATILSVICEILHMIGAFIQES